jgi:hypothetical protein
LTASRQVRPIIDAAEDMDAVVDRGLVFLSFTSELQEHPVDRSFVAAVGTITAYASDVIPADQLRWSARGLVRGAPSFLLAAPAAGAIIGLTWGLGAGLDAGWPSALVIAVSASGGAALYVGVKTRLKLRPARPGATIEQSRRNGVATGSGIAIAVVLSVTAPSALTSSPLRALVGTAVALAVLLVLTGLSVGLCVGSISATRSLDRARRLQNPRWLTVPVGTLVAGIVAGLLGGLDAGLPMGWQQGAASGLQVGLVGCAFGLAATLLYGLVGGPTAGIVVGIGATPIRAVGHDFLFALIAAAAAGLGAGLRRGGAAYLRHQFVFWLLAATDAMPARYGPFLEHAGRLMLLRRRGGGYEFFHRLLLEHLAMRGDAA